MIHKIMKWAVPLLAGSALAISGAQAFAAQVTINPVNDNTIYQGIDPNTGENYELNSCGAGANLACDTGDPAVISTTLDPGVYYLMVEALSFASAGDYRLDAIILPP